MSTVTACAYGDCRPRQSDGGNTKGAIGKVPGYALSLAFHWPTAVTMLRLLKEATTHDHAEAGVGCVMVGKAWPEAVLNVLLSDFLLRVARHGFVAMHEFAHAAVALVMTLAQQGGTNCWSTLRRFCCKVRLGAGPQDNRITWLLKQLVPGTMAPGMHVELPVDGLSAAQQEKIRVAGLVVSVILPFALLLLDNSLDDGWSELFFGALLAAAGAVLSDLPSGPLLGTAGPPAGVFCCGNWGCLVPRDKLGSDYNQKSTELFPQVCATLLSNLLDIVELRGAQAGGCNTFLRGAYGQVVSARSRTVKSKRGNLAKMLFSKFKRQLMLRAWTLNPLTCFRRLRPLPVVLAQGHSRFGTSSEPAEIETHPHQWLGPHWDYFWRRDGTTGAYQREYTEVCVTITHNGDFDGWKLFDEVVPNGILGHFLSRLFHKTNPAKGDSPKLAGMMDLLLTQGRWTASVRLSFVKTGLKHTDEISDWAHLEEGAPNAAPVPQVFVAWASAFEQVFATMAADFKPTKEGLDKLARKVRTALEKEGGLRSVLKSSEACSAMEQWIVSQNVLQEFCQEAVKAFFENDMLAAVNRFFEGAEGTFGVSVSCTLWPQKVVLAAKGQPISLAFDPSRPMAFWASEPASLNTHWPSDDGRKVPAGRSRWDMADATGEAIELYMAKGSFALFHTHLLEKRELNGTLLPYAKYFALPSPHHEDNEERPYHLLVRGIQFGPTPSPLLRCRFIKRLVCFTSVERSTVKAAHFSKEDVIESDLQRIPCALADIDKCWEDRKSLNRISAQKFANTLAALSANRTKPGSDIDVLVFGIENSLWMGQQFAADLSRMYPRLNVVAMSSNWVLGMLQSGEGHVEPANWTISRRKFNLARHGVALGISQSGTTYPTVWAARLLKCNPADAHVFALSGEFDTVLGNSIANDSVFGGTLFSTLSGVCPAEPSTLATMAMHHTLTKLLLFSAEHLLITSCITPRLDLNTDSAMLPWPGAAKNPSCELRLSEVQDLQRLSRSLVATSEELVGMTEHGVPVPSKVHTDLLKSASYLTSHLQEGYWSTFLPAIYVTVTVTLGFPIINGSWTLLALNVLELDPESEGFIAAKYITSFLDAMVYCFLAAIFASAHRLFTGRRLWTRYTARTIVIVESTANYKLLRAYVSKLRSLAWRFTAFGVAGQNGVDHFVHEMTHLAHSDVILAVGRQDGRLSALAAPEASTIMSTQQARFISAKKCGAVEAISVGHNPWERTGLFSRAVTLPTTHRPTFLSEQMLHTATGEHAPSSVMHQVAAIAEETHQEHRALVPWIEKQELIQRLQGRRKVPQEMAEHVVMEVLTEQASKLQINPAHVDLSKLFKSHSSGAPGEQSPAHTSGNDKQAALSAALTRPTGKTLLEAQTTLSRLSPKQSGSWLSEAHTTPNDSEKQCWFSVSQIMATLRGRKMQLHLAEAHRHFTNAQNLQNLFATLVGKPDLDLLRDIFVGWLRSTQLAIKQKQIMEEAMMSHASADVMGVRRLSSRLSSRQSVRQSVRQGSEAEPNTEAEWRKEEEMRRYARSRIGGIFGFSTRTCFEHWQVFTSTARTAAGRPRPDRKGWCVIGANLVGKVTGKKLLAELSVLETLYETRVASAERLLAFFVMFHAAVKPLSRLPFVGYDMDRSESRLRVASTPAPVGFVEKLPKGRDLMSAALTLQQGWKQFQVVKARSSLVQARASMVQANQDEDGFYQAPGVSRHASIQL